MMIHDLWTLS